MYRSAWRSSGLAIAIAIMSLIGACVYVQAAQRDSAQSDGSSGWIVNRADCICGLDDPRILSNPARVDHPRCMDATPEMKQMREQNIDPASPKGIQLTAAAVDRVRHAADVVRAQHGHCSVWKRISHRDGRTIKDLSVEVIAGLSAGNPLAPSTP